MSEKKGLELLREPFEPKHIGKLPKPTKKQTDEVKQDFKKGIRCQVCGGWHHKDVVHLDYVGHAALTDRLLDADPYWYWEPVAFNEKGLPAFDETGGLWIRLYIHDGDKEINRLGYGHAEKSSFKDIGSREKEVIGDALRNAAMRFGAALDLWHKGDLHDDSGEDSNTKEDVTNKKKIPSKLSAQLKELTQHVQKQETQVGLNSIMAEYKGITDEIKKDYPEELKDDGKNLGFTSIYIKKKEELQRKEEMQKQQEDDFKNPFV